MNIKIKTPFIISYFLFNSISPITSTRHLANKKTSTPNSKASKVTKLVPAPGFLQNDDYGEVDNNKFNIDLSLQILNPSVTGAFARARDRWMNILVGDLPDVDNSEGDLFQVYCDIQLPSTVDDIVICGNEAYIDGDGTTVGDDDDGDEDLNILAFTGASEYRKDTFLNSVAFIVFDTYDAARLLQFQSGKNWDNLVLLMMGKAIGFNDLLYIDGPTDYEEDDDNIPMDDDIPDTATYTGSNGIKVWQKDWGCSGTPPLLLTGNYYPLAYWDGTCLVNELFVEGMTYLPEENPTAKLSKLTIAAFEDMGFKVNYSAADPYDVKDILCCNAGVTVAKQPSVASQPPALSEKGKEYATAYGLKVLSERKAEMASRRLQEGNIFAAEDTKARGANSITVILEENGRIYDVVVSDK